MDKMDNNAHSVYLLYYHLIMVIKYRRKVIDDDILNVHYYPFYPYNQPPIIFSTDYIIPPFPLSNKCSFSVFSSFCNSSHHL